MRALPIFFISSLLVVFAGCRFQDDSHFDFAGTELGRTKVDDLARAIDFAGNERQFDQREFLTNVQTSLNRWVANSDELIEKLQWNPDTLLESLAVNSEESKSSAEISSLNFIDTDALYLQEMAWLSHIVNRLPKTRINSFELYRLSADDFKSTGNDTEPLGQLFAKLHPSLNEQGAVQLAKAHLLFDWIVRNIQLLPEIDNSQADIEELRLNDAPSLPAAGIAGTGYQRFPHQTLLYGRGDYVDRAKLFIAGLRIIGLDAFVLATPGESTDADPKPWAVAVLIADELYLFDPRLGLAIPGSIDGSTATLSELQSNRDLLSRLNLNVEESQEENTRYWVLPEQLDSLVGLIYVTPESVSKRFALVQANLTESQNLPYTVVPSAMVQRMPSDTGVEFRAWDIGFKTHQYRQALRTALDDVTNNVLRDKLRWFGQEEGYIIEFPRYRTGRVRYFFGLFENQQELLKFNAIDSFQNLLYSEEDIEGLAVDTMMQERLGILSTDRDSIEFKTRLANVQGHMRLVRRDSGVFIAQSHFDNNSYGATENWCRILRSRKDVSRWSDTINYLAARAAESQKDYDNAILQYRKDKTAPQSHGNLLRARMLEAAVKRVYEG
jgi:hypothetical protein